MDDMARPKKPVTQRAQMRDVADELHVRAGDPAEECRIIARVHRESHNGRMPDLVPGAPLGRCRNKPSAARVAG